MLVIGFHILHDKFIIWPEELIYVEIQSTPVSRKTYLPMKNGVFDAAYHILEAKHMIKLLRAGRLNCAAQFGDWKRNRRTFPGLVGSLDNIGGPYLQEVSINTWMDARTSELGRSDAGLEIPKAETRAERG